jgi:hypothetical protein
VKTQGEKKMRKMLYFLLALAIIAPQTLTSAQWRAAESTQTQTELTLNLTTSLPNYDIRAEAREAQSSNLLRAELRAREEALAALRDEFAPGARENLRVLLNEAGLPQMRDAAFAPAGRLARSDCAQLPRRPFGALRPRPRADGGDEARRRGPRSRHDLPQLRADD